RVVKAVGLPDAVAESAPHRVGQHQRVPQTPDGVGDRPVLGSPRRLLAPHQPVSISPPSTPITLPVIHEDRVRESRTMASPTSSGVVNLRWGLLRSAVSTRDRCSGIRSSDGVTVTPARNALTATP